MFHSVSPVSLSHSSFLQRPFAEYLFLPCMTKQPFEGSSAGCGSTGTLRWTGWRGPKRDLDIKSTGLCWLRGCVKAAQKGWAARKKREGKTWNPGLFSSVTGCCVTSLTEERSTGEKSIKDDWSVGLRVNAQDFQCPSDPGRNSINRQVTSTAPCTC